MATITPELLAKIQSAEDALDAAKGKDAAHDGAVAALNAASAAEAQAQADALAAHQDANAKAADAIDALKAELLQK